MAVELEVFLVRANLPTFEEWAQAISKARFPLTFPESVNLVTHQGYLPVVLRDEETGFEFDVLDIAETDTVPEEVLATGQRPDAIAGFRFREADECDAATVGAAVLALLAEGVFHDPQEGESCSGKEAVTKARGQLRASARLKAAAEAGGELKPAQWAALFEETLRQVHPDYTLNRDCHGRIVECVRQDEAGLHLSQNCIKVYDEYRQCFAILLTTKKLGPGLYTPFVIGSRFNHNQTVNDAYYAFRDYAGGRTRQVAPTQWHSEHRPDARGAREWVGPCSRTAECYLYPFYIDVLCRGAERMTSLFRDGLAFISQWGVSEESLSQPPDRSDFSKTFATEFHMKDQPEGWEGLLEYYNALRLADAHGFPGDLLLQYRHPTMNVRGEDIARATERYTMIPAEIRNVAIFTAYAQDFLTAYDELAHIADTIENLKPTHLPPVPGKEEPWWRFW